MKTNAKKTKSMLVSKNVTVKIDVVKQTDKTITLKGKCDDEVLKSIEIGRGAFSDVLTTVTARHMRSTLLYTCEMWTTRTRNMTKLQSFEMWAYRKMININMMEARKGNKMNRFT